jgi:hypothetical protein
MRNGLVIIEICIGSSKAAGCSSTSLMSLESGSNGVYVYLAILTRDEAGGREGVIAAIELRRKKSSEEIELKQVS